MGLETRIPNATIQVKFTAEDFCEMYNFNVGSAMYFILRATHGDSEARDLKLAKYYLERACYVGLDEYKYIPAKRVILDYDRVCIHEFVSSDDYLRTMCDGETYRGEVSIRGCKNCIDMINLRLGDIEKEKVDHKKA